VDSSTLCGIVSSLVGELSKLGIEWRRTADSRMVVTETGQFGVQGDEGNIVQTGLGVLGSVPV
jgi:hypothetical protein